MGKGSSGGVSLRSKDFTEGGGTEGAHATISEIGWVGKFTYGGRHKDKPNTALYVKFEIDGFDKPWDNNYTAGPSSNWEVVDDGDGIRSTGKQEGLNKNSTAALFLKSVEDAAEASGLDIDDLLPELDEGGHSVRPLEGKRVILTNVKAKTVGGDEKQYIVLKAFEEETDSKRVNGSGRKASSNGSAKIEAATEAAIKELLEDTPKIKKSDLANEIYAANRKDANVKAMMELCFKDKFLAGLDGVEFDQKKGVLTLAD